MNEKIKSKNNKEILDEIFNRLANYMNFPTENDPYFSPLRKELEKRLESWERDEPRKLIVKHQ